MATRNGYKAYKLNSGELKTGMLADIALLNRKSFSYIPEYNPLHSIVYASYGCEVTHTIVDGKPLMEDGTILTLDEEKVVDRVEEIKYKFIP
jgi:5-methylthioadenosine/S-adenosylhomocysteine deaminase